MSALPLSSHLPLSARLEKALRNPVLVQAAAALQLGRLDLAERRLRTALRSDACDVAAIRMMAELAARLGRYRDAEKLLRRALELAPEFDAARANYVTVLHRQSKFEAAHEQVDRLLEASPDDPNYLALKAAVLVRTGGYDAAIQAYETILARHPKQSRLWISLGHVLKTVGRQSESIAAYRSAIQEDPGLGDAWWSLANLKTVRLEATDVAKMQEALDEVKTLSDRYHLHFALGKALEDAGDFAASYDHYKTANQLRRSELPYDPGYVQRHLELTRKLMTNETFDARRNAGSSTAAPIFIVGLPRAGSTLIEQILASHSLVEGTMELPDIGTIAQDLRSLTDPQSIDGDHSLSYLPKLLALSSAELAGLGHRYLQGTRIQRKEGRPRFIDKMPNNFLHIGLVHLALPNAVIIDARRHPMANCFSAYKQHFSRGQAFSYDLGDLGGYYRCYLELMDHFELALPGRVHRVIHEKLVAEPEPQIRALLNHCGLPFEPACMTPHETKRAVRTASSEQVRQPISSGAIDHWRQYQEWLSPLEQALGDAIDRYAR